MIIYNCLVLGHNSFLKQIVPRILRDNETAVKIIYEVSRYFLS